MAILEQRIEPQADRRNAFPRGIRLLAWARAIRWAGWGFGEALIPVFIASFSGTFAQMGMFTSTFEMAALASLPFIGMWADRVPAKRIILISLLLYPLVGINYFIAGTLRLGIFVVLAKAVNGFLSELETVGVETYYRRTSHRSRIGASFGYLDTWANAAWICAALAGMMLVSYVPIHDLLLSISPFALIAYLVASRAPQDWLRHVRSNDKVAWRHSFSQLIAQWQTWGSELRLLSSLVVFSSVCNALTDFFIPIDAYLTGANLPMVVLLTVFGAIPSLFGYYLGRLADLKNRSRLVALGLLIITGILLTGAFISGYWFKLVAVFLVGLIVEMFDVVKSSLITVLGPASSYGIRGSTFEFIATIGDLVSPVAIGIGLDLFGFSSLLVSVGGVAVVLSIMYSLRRAHTSEGVAKI